MLPIEQQDIQHPGFWYQLGQDLKGVASAVATPSGFSPYPGMDQEAKSAAAGQSFEEDQARKDAGYSGAYRALVPVAKSVGVNVGGMEESAKEGDVGGVLGHAAATPAVLAVGKAVSSVAPKAGALLPSKAEAGSLLGEVSEAIGKHPVIADDAADIAMEILDKKQTGAKLGGLSKPINQFLSRVTDPDTPLTWGEAREFEQNFRKLTPSQKMNLGAGVRPLLREFTNSLRLSIEETADAAGQGDKFRQGMRGYRAGAMAENAKDFLKENAVKTAIGSAGSVAAGGYGLYKAATK